MNQDRIFIEQLPLETIIGINPHERKKKQPILVDLELFIDAYKVALSDDISVTVDYHSLVTKLSNFVAVQQYHLIETLAEKIAEYILDYFDIAKITVKVTKPKALVQTKWVGVTITREKSHLRSKESF